MNASDVIRREVSVSEAERPPARRSAERSSATFATLGDWFVAEHASLYRFALALTGQPAVAQDLVQDTFVRMSLAGARVEHEGVGAYARRTLVNLHRSRLRRWYRERRALERLAARTPAFADPPADPADPQLFAALKTLSPMQRAVIALRYLEDRSEADTAKILGVAPGTIKSHAHRALTALRGRLEEVTNDG